MKKALVVLLALVLAGSLVFAQEASAITFGSWGRALWNVASGTNDEPVTDIHQSWGGAAPRTSLNVRGDSDNVSYALDIFGNGTGLGVGDNAYIEVRPGDWAALTVGKMDKNETRGDATFGIWNWDRIGVLQAGYADQEGWIFGDLSDADGFGLSARLYPIEGLTIGAAVPLNEGHEGAETLANTYAKAANYFVMYNIDGIGKIKVGYDTVKDGIERPIFDDNGIPSLEEKAYGVINAAFDLVAVENFYFAVGGFIPTGTVYKAVGLDDLADPDFSLNSVAEEIRVNAYARYSMDPFAFHVLFGSKINTYDMNDAEDGAFGFSVGAGIDWNVLDNVPVFLDVRYANGVYMAHDSSDNNDCFTAAVGVSKLWSNGQLGIAFECATNGYGRYAHDADEFVWTIPVKFEYSF